MEDQIFSNHTDDELAARTALLALDELRSFEDPGLRDMELQCPKRRSKRG